MPYELSEEERRLNLETRLLAIVSSFGGQQIIAGQPMADMVNQLADAVEALGRDGYLPGQTDPVHPRCPTCGSFYPHLKKLARSGFRCDDPTGWHAQ